MAIVGRKQLLVSFRSRRSPVFVEPLLDKRPKHFVRGSSSSPSRMGTQDPGLWRTEPHPVAYVPSSHLLPSLAAGECGEWGCISELQIVLLMGFAGSPALTAPPRPPCLVQLSAPPRLYLHIMATVLVISGWK